MHPYVKLALDCLKSEFNSKKIDLEVYFEAYPELRNYKASFVTIKKNNALRGCIGSLVAHRSLGEDICKNSKMAAFEDTRFIPLQKDELNQIQIEISILTNPEFLEYTDLNDLRAKIQPNVDGVVLEYQNHRATFLPSVWEELVTFDEFFYHLLQKANLPVDIFTKHPNIYVYSAKKIV